MSSSPGAALPVPRSLTPTPSCWRGCPLARRHSSPPGRARGFVGTGPLSEALERIFEHRRRRTRRTVVAVRLESRSGDLAVTASGPTPIRRWPSMAAAGSTSRGPNVDSRAAAPEPRRRRRAHPCDDDHERGVLLDAGDRGQRGLSGIRRCRASLSRAAN